MITWASTHGAPASGQPTTQASTRSSCTSAPQVRRTISSGIRSKPIGSTRPASVSAERRLIEVFHVLPRVRLVNTCSSAGSAAFGLQEFLGELAPGRVRQKRNEGVEPIAAMVDDLRPPWPPAPVLDQSRLQPLLDLAAAMRAKAGRLLRPAFRPLDHLPQQFEELATVRAGDFINPHVALVVGALDQAHVLFGRRRASAHDLAVARGRRCAFRRSATGRPRT